MDTKSIFWLLEDDEMTQMVVSSYVLKFLSLKYTLKVVTSAKEIIAKSCDIILSDQHGVDVESLNSNGALLITMSGNKNLKVDVWKPFRSKDLEKILNDKLLIRTQNAA
jgi:hypothetical protein